MCTRDARPDPAGRFFCLRPAGVVSPTVGFLTEVRPPAR